MEISLGGGGRYDKLVELFGGEPTPAVGVAHGLDRIALTLDQQNIKPKFGEHVVAVIPIGEETISKALAIAQQLKREGVPVEMEIMGRTVSRALQDADRRKVAYAVILGPKELKEGKVVLRDMKNRQQSSINIEDLTETLTKK
jgi:histidyl-tRNA synthetase